MVRRFVKESDNDELEKMMESLWPDEVGPFHIKGETVFVWEEGKRLGGFLQLAIRPYVDGADIAPVPHIEGWYVKPNFRNRGIGKALVEAAEAWSIRKGYTELTSDVLVDNEVSLKAHEAIGFKPTERIQYFKKKLN